MTIDDTIEEYRIYLIDRRTYWGAVRFGSGEWALIPPEQKLPILETGTVFIFPDEVWEDHCDVVELSSDDHEAIENDITVSAAVVDHRLATFAIELQDLRDDPDAGIESDERFAGSFDTIYDLDMFEFDE